MAGPTLSVLACSDFPQRLRNAIDRAFSSVERDRAAIDQARRELGPNADPKKVLARAQEIKQEGDRG